MSPTFLQILLLLNVFLIGALAAVAIQHAYAHFRPTHHEEEKPHKAAPNTHLPPAVREQLLHAAKANFQIVLEKSANQLQRDLESTGAQLNKQLEKLGSKIIDDETERYQTTLHLLRDQAEATINGAQADVTQHQADIQTYLTEHQAKLEAELNAKMTAEHDRLVQQLDTKLADAVSSFLVETLQHNVDLGAQSTYLTAMLEEHKDELTKGMKNDT